MELSLALVAAGIAVLVYGYYASGPAPAVVKCSRCKREYVTPTGKADPSGLCAVCEYSKIVSRDRQ